MSVDQTFDTPYGQLVYARADDNRINSAGAYAGSAEWFNYSAATKSFSVVNVTGRPAIVSANPVIRFGEADRVVTASNARQTVYKSTVNGYDYDLTLFNPGPGNDLLALTYSSIGMTRQTMSGPLATYPKYTSLTSHAFAYGIGTPSTAVKPAGTVTYRGILMGEAAILSSLPVPVYRISGTISITVNFADGTNSGVLELIGTDDRTGAVTSLGEFQFSVDDGKLVGFAGGLGRADGDAAYQYYGPAAQELSGGAGLQIMNSPYAKGGLLALSFAFAAKR